MNVTPTATTRIGLRQQGRQMLENVARQRRALEDINRQLATGEKLARPSDAPADAAVAMQIRKRLETEDRYAQSMRRHSAQLAEADNVLAEATDVVRSARTVALDMANSGVSPEEMDAQIEVITGTYNQLLSLANSQIQGSHLFAGDRLTDPPFQAAQRGVVYRGGDPLYAKVADGRAAEFTVDGGAAFGGKSVRHTGTVDLDPRVTPDTRLRDLAGAAGRGVGGGVVRLSDGTATATLDLRDADTLGDVADAINAAGVGALTAAVNPAGDGLRISGGPAVTFADVNGSLARDLGLAAEGGPAAIDGGDLGARLTELTPVADLAGPPDLAGGLRITLGGQERVADTAGAQTVGDVLNAIRKTFDGLDVGLDAERGRIVVRNRVQGQPLGIAETAGGTTARDLGLQTFHAAAPLADFNGGAGVRLDPDGPDLEITNSAGTVTLIDLAGAATAGDVADRITAAGAALSAAVDPAAGGLTLADAAGGPGALRVRNVGQSHAATDLGLDGDSAGGSAGGTLAGRDVNRVRVRGVFASLDQLSDALRARDVDAIRRAAEALEADEQAVIRERGVAGARAREFEQRLGRAADREITARALLSELEDVDYGEAVTRFQTMQTALQATYRSGGQLMQTSLMDFLG